MELIIFVLALVVVAGLAMRFGHDSRETVSSKEQTLAELGLARDRPWSSHLVRGIARRLY